MKQEHLAKALEKLTRINIGIKEAAALMAVPQNGITYEALIEKLRLPRQNVKTRFAVLRSKKLIATTYLPDGTPLHRPSTIGAKIIKAVCHE
jgi:hypothetical protein